MGYRLYHIVLYYLDLNNNIFQEYWLFNAYEDIVDELCTGILSENVDGDLMHDDDYENLLSIDKFLSTTA